jgi:hypothetical protein
MEGMPRTARVVTWNGRDVLAELRELPAGRYVVEAIDDDAPALSPDEEAGIEVALESYRQSRIVDAKRARQIIDAALGVERQLHRRAGRRRRRRDHLSGRTKPNGSRESGR